MTPTQTQLVGTVAERDDLSKAEAKRALGALEQVVLAELGNAETVRFGGLARLTVRVKPAIKKRNGRNLDTGEELTLAAKPASRQASPRPPVRWPSRRARSCRYRRLAVGSLHDAPLGSAGV